VLGPGSGVPAAELPGVGQSLALCKHHNKQIQCHVTISACFCRKELILTVAVCCCNNWSVAAHPHALMAHVKGLVQ